MSRSIKEIFNESLTEKETFASLDDLVPNPDSAQTFLDDLTSTSKVAIWRLLLWVQAVAIFIHEGFFDVFKSDVEKRALEIIPATTRFYVLESFKFQLGDELVFIDGTFKFEDSTSAAALAKQIIKQASARDINEVVTIKIAQDDGSGGLEELSALDKTAFDAYIEKIKIAGIKTIIISDVPDILKLAYTIEFDPLVMKSDGFLLEDPGATIGPVQQAINDNIEGLDFDSIFRVQDLTDSIQLARGVVNVIADVVEAKFGLLDFTDILAVPTEIYLPNAGYLVTDPSPILILTPALYDAGTSYTAGNQVRFNGIVFEANQSVSTGESPDTNPEKWNTVSNLTFIST